MKPKQSVIRREMKQEPTVAHPGSPVAKADRGIHTKSGFEESRESVDLHSRIAHRAYELYERGGSQDGHNLNDWLQAEWEFRGS